MRLCHVSFHTFQSRITCVKKKKTMGGFNHSVKVPTQYKRTAAILKKALSHEKSLKNLIYEEKHAKIGSLQKTLSLYIENRSEVDAAIEATNLLKDNPRFCPALCKVLVTQSLFGKYGINELKGESKPVQTIRDYHERLLKALNHQSSNNSQGTSTSSKQASKGKGFRYVRVNTNLVSIPEIFQYLADNEFIKREDTYESYKDYLDVLKSLQSAEYIVDMHLDDVLVFHGDQRRFWATSDLVKERKLMLQDKATCLVANLLEPEPGSILLDLCAAPGMKTIQCCNYMQNKGKIYAVEMNSDRFQTLKNMTTSAGCEIVETIHSDALEIDSERCPDVDYILVDPSCSGSGMQRLSLDEEKKDPVRLKKLAGLQTKMLSHAMTSFPKVKRIAYSTCSIYEEENEQVIEWCLNQNPGFKLLSCKKALRNKWSNTGNQSYKNIGKKCLYSRPDSDFTDGIFIAILEKCDD